MKALSIRHPWIDVILSGSKTVEIRTWATRYRGRILLHASGAYGISEREAAIRLKVRPPDPETLSAIVGHATLTECRPVQSQDWAAACLPPLEGRLWAWVLADPRPIGPIAHAGARTLFDVEDTEVLAAIS